MLLIGTAQDMTIDQYKTHFALWSFAKAPLILSMDLANLGNITNSSSLASVLNPKLIKINQASNGEQAKAIDLSNATGQNDSLAFYKMNVEEKNGELYTAVLVVNWYDRNITHDAMLDLTAHGIALSSFDKCSITDLWTDEKVQTNGGVQALKTTNMKMHDHKAYKMKCDPFG